MMESPVVVLNLKVLLVEQARRGSGVPRLKGEFIRRSPVTNSRADLSASCTADWLQKS